MKNLLLTLICVLTFSITSSAQFNLGAGVAFSSVGGFLKKNSYDGKYHLRPTTIFRPGVSFVLSVDYELSKRFSLQASPTWLKYGESYGKYDPNFIPTIFEPEQQSGDFYYNSITVPLELRYSPFNSEKWIFSVNGGMGVSILLSGKNNIAIHTYDENDEIEAVEIIDNKRNTDDLRANSTFFTFGLDIGYRFTEKFGIKWTQNYFGGLNDVTRKRASKTIASQATIRGLMYF